MRVPQRRLAPVLVLTCILAVLAGGCGSSRNGSGGAATVPGGGKVGEGKRGGDVTFLSSGDIESADPGQIYLTFGYMVQYAVNRPLYSFAPDDPVTPQPDLAVGPPEIAADNKTLTIKIRDDVRYAPPVDRVVKAQDVKYAIERAFTSNVANGYATSYFADVEGAPKAPVPIAKLEDFPGLQTPDDTTLVIKLTRPGAQQVAAALVMPITAPVPEEYASRFDRKSPTSYDRHVAFSGPYMIDNDKTGKLVGYDPGKRVEIVRNPNWNRATDYRPAFLDSITIQEGNSDTTLAARRTLSGKKLLCCDTGLLPPPILRRALTRFTDQLGRVPAGGTRWIALNTKEKPFDNLNVRKAAIAGVDRNALRLSRGGEEVGPIAQHYLPPGIPGFEESGGEAGFTELDWMQKPEGDPLLAKKYMLAAKKEGVPVTADGRYAGRKKLLMVGDNADPGLQTATVAQAELAKLGFKTNFRKVPRDTMYSKFCQVPKSRALICPTVGWFKDFTDPESMLQPTFDGKAIEPAGNTNYSQLDVSEISDAMTKAAQLSGGERTDAWADINEAIVAQAPGIPFIWDDAFQLQSSDMSGVMSSYSATWDLSFTSIE